MKYQILKLRSFSAVIFSLVLILMFSSSCREEYSEEEALDLLRKIDVSFFIYDRSTNNFDPINGATVILMQGDEELEVTTVGNGIAKFENVDIGNTFYRISATNYLSHSAEIEIYNDGGLIKQQVVPVGLFNLSDESLATVKGRVLIETDLTNDETEFADNVKLHLRVSVDDQYLDFSEVTDEEGIFEFKVPTERTGSYTIMRIPDLELPQKIAYKKLSTDDRIFPEILPQIEDVMTVFSTSTSTNRNYNNYPYQSISPLYAIAEAAPKEGNTAVISNVFSEGGNITGITILNGGNYSGDADGVARINIYSLLGGSGAYIDINVQEFSSLYDAYYYGYFTLHSGSGYPDYDFLLNRMSYRSPTPSTGDSREKYLGYLTPGSTTIVNIDYGTGTYRLYDYD